MNVKAEMSHFSELLLEAADCPWELVSTQTRSVSEDVLHCHEAWELRFFLSPECGGIEKADLIPARVWHRRILPDVSARTHTVLAAEKGLFVRHLHYTVGALNSPYGGHLLPLLSRLYRQEERNSAALFDELRLLLALIYRSADVGETPYPAEKIDQFVAKLEAAYFDSRLSIAQLAEDCGYSPNYIQKLFRRKTGMTPREYLIQFRMKRAKQLLDAGGYSIKEVASLCGFSSRQYFANAFHAYYGCAPGARLAGKNRVITGKVPVRR